VRNLGGEYHQLATSLLQIESEFYSTIRPKRTIRRGERPLHALRERGVEYVEVRCMDLDPFEPAGISAETMRFLDVFLLHCLLLGSPPDTPQESVALSRNQHRVAAHGREPGLMLERDGQSVSLQAWGQEVLDACRLLAETLDALLGTGTRYQDAVQTGCARWQAPQTSPSARVLDTMQADFGGSFHALVQALSSIAHQHWRARPLEAAMETRLALAAEVSLREQRKREESDDVGFEAYRVQYLSPERLLV
jgi:glutamate--cysteine ligase